MTIQIRSFEEEFGIKSGFGPRDIDGNPKWNRCWSHIPDCWIPAIHNFLNKVKTKYIFETIDMEEDDPSVDVYFDQIKEKFDELRVYYHFSDKNRDNWDEMESDLDQWIIETIREIKQADPNYGKYLR